MSPRRQKRMANRLAKKGLTFLRVEQNDPQLITMRIIMETKRQRLGRAFVVSRDWLRRAPPRRVADGIIADYIKGYGQCPA